MVAGLVTGVVAGILPGLGPAGVMGILFLALTQLEPLHILLFFICILTSAQYFGSTIAILTGVPGDPAAVPASKWGFELAKAGHGSRLLYSTARYSLISGLLAFTAVMFIAVADFYSAKTMSIHYQSVIMIVAMLSIMLISENRWYINILLCLIGLAIGFVGYSVNYQDYYLTLGIDALKFGIPWLSVLLGLMAIPGAVSLLKFKINTVDIRTESTHSNKLTAPAMRGGMIGFVTGMIPGLSYILSSMMAAKLEQRLSNNPEHMVIASESANNSGAVSVLLPFMMLGVPITASESIVFTMLTTSTNMASIPSLFVNNWMTFVVSFVILNVVLFLTAWKCSVRLCHIVFAHAWMVGVLSIVISIMGIVWIGLNDHRLWIGCVTLLVATLLGLAFRKTDWTPLIFAMLLEESLETIVYQIQQFY